MGFSAVRRSFLARNNGESPATAVTSQTCQHAPGACSTIEASTEAAWAENEPNASSPMATLLAADRMAVTKGLQNGSPNGLMKMALSADEKELASLSLVLDTTLSIFYARAAVANLLSHIGAAGGSFVPEVEPSLGRYIHPWTWPILRTKVSCSFLDRNEEEISQQLSLSRRSLGGSDEGDTRAGKEVPMGVVRGILEVLAVPEYQQRFVDLTKMMVIW